VRTSLEMPPSSPYLDWEGLQSPAPSLLVPSCSPTLVGRESVVNPSPPLTPVQRIVDFSSDSKPVPMLEDPRVEVSNETFPHERISILHVVKIIVRCSC